MVGALGVGELVDLAERVDRRGWDAEGAVVVAHVAERDARGGASLGRRQVAVEAAQRADAASAGVGSDDGL